MGWLRDIVENHKKKLHENALKSVKEEAIRLFQIEEHNSLLWLIYDGHLIAPFSMLCNGKDANECIALINEIRDLYVARIVDGKEG